jgi:hypothetical protein
MLIRVKSSILNSVSMSSNALYLTACKMVHLRRKCSIFSSSSPHTCSWHMVSTWFWLNRALLACKILLDCSVLLNYDNPVCKDKLLLKQLTQLESQCRRFIYNMHTSRYKMLIRVKHILQLYWNSICVSCWYCFDINQWMLFTWFVYFCIEEIYTLINYRHCLRSLSNRL